MNLSQTKDLMTRHQIRPTRSLGQNFLVDERAVLRIVELASIGPDDHVLEIGPGLGHLTVALASKARSVTAIEIDRHLLPAFQEVLTPLPNVELIQADALTVDLRQLVSRSGGAIRVVANLPYYVTTELMLKVLLEVVPCAGLYLMMQKEAAERIMGEPGSRSYSPIGVIARSQGTMKRVLSVSQGSFFPQPHVDSVVLQWSPHREPLLRPDLLADFAVFVQACFRQRRKTLTNSFTWPDIWQRSGWQIVPMDRLIEEAGLSPSVRAESLQPAQFCELFSAILATQ